MFLRSLLMLSGALLALAAPAGAQGCPPLRDDLFSSAACCTAIVNNGVPAMPADMQTKGQYYCDVGCQTLTPFKVTVNFSNPTQIDCNHYTISLTVNPDTGPVPVSSGTLLATFLNTYRETNLLTGLTGQIWRFQLSGELDFEFDPNTDIPCPVPPCILNFNDVHFVGTIDYYCGPVGDGGASEWRVRYNLHHMADAIEHGNGSARTIVPSSHPATNYSLVGPDPVILGPAVFPSLLFGTAANGEEREMDVATPTCFAESPFGALDSLTVSQSGGTTCVGGPPGTRWQPVTWQTTYRCGGISPLLPVIQDSNAPAGYYYACRHPLSASPSFPEGRDVYFFYSQVNPPSLPGPLCAGATVSTAASLGPEFVTGVTTQYLQPNPIFRSRYFRLPIPLFPRLQTDIANHVNPGTTSTIFGVASWGSWWLSAMR